MDVHVARLLEGATQATGVVVIVDVFRAFTTACEVVAAGPGPYALLAHSEVARRQSASGAVCIGKAELGETLRYDAPNSPLLVRDVDLSRRAVFHRTGAGARGLLAARRADVIVTGAFVNAAATARYVRELAPERVTIVAMGHEAGTPSLEDELCAQCIRGLLLGRAFDLAPHIEALRLGPGKYFFEGAWEYPPEDFGLCLQRDVFGFVLQAELFEDHAVLHRVDVQ